MQLAFPVPSTQSKRCVSCGETKSLTEFHRHRGKPDGLQNRCKPCNIALNVKYYAEHAEQRKARIKAWGDALKSVNRVAVLDHLLMHPCVDCGEADPIVLEFDHRRDKQFDISALVCRPVIWDVIRREIEKCEVRCANCHRRRTCIERDTYRVQLLRALSEGASR